MEKLSTNIITNILSYASPNDSLTCLRLNKAIKAKVSTSLVNFSFPLHNRNFLYPMRQMIDDSVITHTLLSTDLKPKLTIAKLDLSLTRVTDKTLYNLLGANQLLTSLTINRCYDISANFYEMLLNSSVLSNLTELTTFDTKVFNSEKPGLAKVFPKLKFLRCHFLSDAILSEALQHPSIELLQCQESINLKINRIVKGLALSKSLKYISYPETSIGYHYLEPIEHPILKGVIFYNTACIITKNIEKLINAYSIGFRDPPSDNYSFSFENTADKIYIVISQLLKKYQFCATIYTSKTYDYVGWAISKNYIKLANLLLSYQENMQIIIAEETQGFINIFDGTARGVLEPTIIMFDAHRHTDIVFKYEGLTSQPAHILSIPVMKCSFSCWIMEGFKDTKSLKTPLMLCETHFSKLGSDGLKEIIDFKMNAKASYFPNTFCKLSKETLLEITKKPINLVNCNTAVYGNHRQIYSEVSKLLYKNILKLDLLKQLNSTFPALLPNESKYIDKSFMAKKSLLLIAIELKKQDIYTFLIENDFGLNLMDKCQWTPLHQAAASNDVDAAKMLLEKRPDMDINAVEWNNKTSLTIANKLGYKEMIHFLKSRNALASKECIII